MSDERDDGKCQPTEKSTNDDATNDIGEVVNTYDNPTGCHHNGDEAPQSRKRPASERCEKNCCESCRRCMSTWKARGARFPHTCAIVTIPRRSVAFEQSLYSLVYNQALDAESDRESERLFQAVDTADGI